MAKKLPIILLCSVAIVVAALFTVTQLMAMGQVKRPSSGDYQATTRFNEIGVAAPELEEPLKVRYSRDNNGCVSKVEFYNDPANCGTGEQCQKYLDEKPGQKAEWREANQVKEEPKIWGENLVGAGSTKGDSDVCGDFSFTVAGSPGWYCTYVAASGRTVCSCIGFYVGPPAYPGYNYCCDPSGCVPGP